MVNSIIHGDCLQVMKNISSGSIDMILADLPYEKTKNSWDILIPFDKLWEQYERIVKDNGAIILFGQDKFSAKLMLSNEKIHRYNLIWEKTTVSNPFNANKMPLRNHEDILVFYKQLPVYNPQKTTGHERKVATAHHKRNSNKSSNYGTYNLTSYDSTERFPKSVWKFATDKQKEQLNPTQKPLLLIKELIKTYSNEDDLVLENTAGSCTVAIAALETKRKYLCIEKEIKYVEIGKKRVDDWNKISQTDIFKSCTL